MESLIVTTKGEVYTSEEYEKVESELAEKKRILKEKREIKKRLVDSKEKLEQELVNKQGVNDIANNKVEKILIF